MKTRLFAVLERLRESFWFKPSCMALFAVGLSFVMVALDRALPQARLRQIDWIYSGGAEGASAVLQTIASSTITVAGVVFSLTLATLSLAASQFGSRLLRNFMRDGLNQLVLGTFIATFLYCLLVLRTIRRADEVAFVPHLSVTLGLVLALASLWMLIYFIHHVSVSIQADEVIARVGADLDQTVERMFPKVADGARQSARDDASAGSPPDVSRDKATITAGGDGYLQLVDADRLASLASRHDLVLRLERRPGHYVLAETVLVTCSPGARLTADIAAQIRAALILAHQRSAAQDVEFTILELVEIAVRALSPGINDPFTAIACIDRLGSALSQLARRGMPPTQRCDEQGRLRVILLTTDFSGCVDAAFNQLRQYARNNADVMLRLLETVAAVAAATHREADRAALRRQADMIARGAGAAFAEPEDRQALNARYLAAMQALRAPDGAVAG